METQKIYPLAFSFECFPASSRSGLDRLVVCCNSLATVNPCYISVTYGAGGSTRGHTIEAVEAISGTTQIEVVPHIAGIGAGRSEICSLLDYYRQCNIRHIVVLRGDIPSGLREYGEFRYASELIDFIRREYGDYFFIEVAAYPETHPQAKDAISDLNNFKRKVESGADAALTQYFYNPDAYLRFVDACEKLGIDLPIVPGIMPITDYPRLARFSDSYGAEIPRWVRRRLEDYQDNPSSLLAFGEEVVTRLCETILTAGAPGLHFYTMNRSAPTLAIWKNLGLSSDRATRAQR